MIPAQSKTPYKNTFCGRCSAPHLPAATRVVRPSRENGMVVSAPETWATRVGWTAQAAQCDRWPRGCGLCPAVVYPAAGTWGAGDS